MSLAVLLGGRPTGWNIRVRPTLKRPAVKGINKNITKTSWLGTTLERRI